MTTRIIIKSGQIVTVYGNADKIKFAIHEDSGGGDYSFSNTQVTCPDETDE